MKRFLFLVAIGFILGVNLAKASVLTESQGLPAIDLSQLAKHLRSSLKANYGKVRCERLSTRSIHTHESFSLWQAAGQISGPVHALDVGEIANILEKDRHHKNWSIHELAVEVGQGEGSSKVLGAAAAFEGDLGFNAELMINGQINSIWNSRIGYLAGGKNRGKPMVTPAKSDRIGPLGNIAFFEKKNDEILWVSVESRLTSEVQDSFTMAIKNILNQDFPDQVLGLVGFIRVSEVDNAPSNADTKIRLHIMPAFLDYDIKASEVNQWLDIFNIRVTKQNPFYMNSFIFNHDRALPFAIRQEHSHGYRDDESIAGHYHGDISSPETIRYDAVFVPVDRIYSIK